MKEYDMIVYPVFSCAKAMIVLKIRNMSCSSVAGWKILAGRKKVLPVMRVKKEGS